MAPEKTPPSEEKNTAPGLESVSAKGEKSGDQPEVALETVEQNGGAALKEDYQKKYTELYEQYVRLAADFENYRRRYAQEQESSRKYGAETTARELIPFIDNLERAANSLSENSDSKVLYQSFRLVYNQLIEALKGLGFQRMNAGGQPFDPQYHEAVTQVETDEHPENTVVNELQSGYMLHDRVLRPALVTVSVSKSNAETSPDAGNPFAQANPGVSANDGAQANR